MYSLGTKRFLCLAYMVNLMKEKDNGFGRRLLDWEFKEAVHGAC